jgi:signal transduction histidine kinase
MAEKFQNLFQFLTAKLSRQIVFWVFVNIVLIEAILLIPSAHRREQELLNYRQEILSAKAEGLLMATNGALTDSERLARLGWLLKDSAIIGGTLYRTGQPIGSFGTISPLNLSTVEDLPRGSLLLKRQKGYHSKIPLPTAESQYQLVLRQDATPIKQELYAFMGRIALLVLIISAFVTLATLVVLKSLLITPILLLRQDLLNAGKAVSNNQCLAKFQSHTYMQRDDELGEVIEAFQQMFQQIKEAITERDEAENTLERLAEIGQQTAMIVHDVRNPLSTVLMGLTSVERMDLPEKAHARLSLALEEAGRLERMLNELLTYARNQNLEFINLEINEFIAELLESLRTLPNTSSRTLHFKPGAMAMWVSGDRDKLKQVFVNLVENACEAVSEGEDITLKVRHLSDENQICVSVHNGGAPIPLDLLPQITQPFVTTKSTGNGLGLAIVQRIVEAHGGTFQIESTETTGTKVTVHLPAVCAPTSRSVS